MIIIGTSDVNHNFKLAAIQLSNVENVENYNFLYESLQNPINDIFDIEWESNINVNILILY